MTGKRLAYIRVSTADQNIARQQDILKDYNIDKYFVDKISGSKLERPELDNLLSYCREDDTVYVCSIDRLARNVKHLYSLVEDLKDKRVNIHFIKENLVFNCNEKTPMSNLLLAVLGAIAEFERELIKERQKEGILIAKKKGKYLGKQPKLNKEQIDKLVYDFKNTRISKTALAKKYNLSRKTLYDYLDKYKDLSPEIQTDLEELIQENS